MTVDEFVVFFSKLSTFRGDADIFAQYLGYQNVFSLRDDDLEAFVDLFSEHRRKHGRYRAP